MQALGTVLLGLFSTLHVTTLERQEGTLAAVRVRDAPGLVWVTGQLGGLWVICALFSIGSGAAIGITLWASGVGISPGGLVVAALVIAAYVRWFASYLENVVTAGIAGGLFSMLGFLKPWADEISGLGWWLSRPVPNLGWISEVGRSCFIIDFTSLPLVVPYAVVVFIIFALLSARAIQRHEF